MHVGTTKGTVLFYMYEVREHTNLHLSTVSDTQSLMTLDTHVYVEQCIGKIYFKYIFEEFQEPIISILRTLGKIHYLNNLKYILLYFLVTSN